MAKIDLTKLPPSINYFMDRMELLKKLPSKSIDIALIDPEYGINSINMNMGTRKINGKEYESTATKIGRMNKGGGHMKNSSLVKMPYDWDNEIPKPEFFKEIFRVSVNQIIWGGNYFPLPPTRCLILWDKLQSLDTYSAFELAWTSFDYPTKIYKIGSRGGANDENKIHPNQKPVKLYQKTLLDFAKPGQTILDTGTGSGSLRIAIEILRSQGFNLQYIGCDNNPTYHALEHKRFNNYLKKINSLPQLEF